MQPLHQKTSRNLSSQKLTQPLHKKITQPHHTKIMQPPKNHANYPQKNHATSAKNSPIFFFKSYNL